MAKIQIKAGDDLAARLYSLEAILQDKICGAAIYKGGEIVTDTIRESIESLPTDDRFVFGGTKKSGPSEKQKKGLSESLGIAKIRNDDGFLNIKVGFSGYNSVKTERWPKGQPNLLVARAVERGTSFMSANPFIKKSVAKARKRAKEAMVKEADREIKKIMK